MSDQLPKSPENRRKTGEANLARGEAHRWKPGQSGNPGGRPRSARRSEACRAKLASSVPGDATGRTYAEAIADSLAGRALKGDIRAAQELADRAEGRPGQSPVPEADQGVKVIVVDIPRPQRGVIMPDIGPDMRPIISVLLAVFGRYAKNRKPSMTERTVAIEYAAARRDLTSTKSWTQVPKTFS